MNLLKIMFLSLLLLPKSSFANQTFHLFHVNGDIIVATSDQFTNLQKGDLWSGETIQFVQDEIQGTDYLRMLKTAVSKIDSKFDLDSLEVFQRARNTSIESFLNQPVVVYLGSNDIYSIAPLQEFLRY